jgi:hypothetical protein
MVRTPPYNGVAGRIRFTSGQSTVGGEQSWKNQVTEFMRSKNMEEDMAEHRHL